MSPTQATTPTPQLTMPEQLTKSQAFAWEDYRRLARIHVWPAGSDMTWVFIMWGLLMNAHRLNTPPHIVLVQAIVHMFVSTFAHSAGCIWDDICDRDIDRHVERTKSRPIAQGLISVPAALLWFQFHFLGYAATLSCLGRDTMILGVLFFMTTASVYPFTKRVTHWPQAVLGISCSTSTMVGWYAVSRTVNWSILGPLMLAIICWVIHFDTIYACPDKKYDKQIGVYSTALLFGDYTRPILSVFCTGFVVCLAYAGYLNQQGPLFYVISVASAALGVLWQLVTIVDIEQDGKKLFRANGILGIMTVCGLFADYLYKVAL